jgi:hypothetical protein
VRIKCEVIYDTRYSSKLCLAGCFPDVALILSTCGDVSVPVWTSPCAAPREPSDWREGSSRARIYWCIRSDIIDSLDYLLWSNLWECICIVCMSTAPLLRLGKVTSMPFEIASSPKSLDWRHSHTLNAIGQLANIGGRYLLPVDWLSAFSYHCMLSCFQLQNAINVYEIRVYSSLFPFQAHSNAQSCFSSELTIAWTIWSDLTFSRSDASPCFNAAFSHTSWDRIRNVQIRFRMGGELVIRNVLESEELATNVDNKFYAVCLCKIEAIVFGDCR